jgi:hypothetical protein
MRILSAFLILFAATAASARRPTVGAQPFPNDYVPHPCASKTACKSFDPQELVGFAAATKGLTIDQDWIDKRWPDMIELIGPTCAKLATCYATPGNSDLFCFDLLFPEFWSLCERYPEGSKDREQCSMFVRMYMFGADLSDRDMWKQAQACAAEKTPRVGTRPMKVWMSQEKIDDNYSGMFTVYALDPETRVPIQALVTMEGVRLFARSPGGKSWTNYELKWPAKFIRVPSTEGHTKFVAPTITVTANGFEPVTLTLPMEPPKVVVKMSPAPEQLKRGKNNVTVTAHDEETGKPVELRVMLGETILGDTNEPLEIELKRGQKREEIWVTSLFDRYEDLVVAPAEK